MNYITIGIIVFLLVALPATTIVFGVKKAHKVSILLLVLTVLLYSVSGIALYKGKMARDARSEAVQDGRIPKE